MAHGVSQQGAAAAGRLVAHDWRVGDALVFPSHKYHCVAPITAGVRRVLVLEFWEGVERWCDHRCEVPRGECAYRRVDEDSEALLDWIER